MIMEENTNGTEGSAEGHLYQVPTSVVVILSLFYGLISLTAFVGNSLVIYVVVISRYDRHLLTKKEESCSTFQVSYNWIFI